MLLAGAAFPASAYAQCVTDRFAVDACLGGVRITSGPSLNLDLMSPGVLPPGLTFTRASTATYFDAAGTMQTVGNDVPRWDYDPITHALRGLLVEEPRTNLLLGSGALGTQSVAVTAQSYVLSFYGPGTVTMSGAATGALVGTGAIPQRVTQVITPAAGTLTLTVAGQVLDAQLEAGVFVTSWIPTAAVAVARAIEAASTPLSAWYNPAVGSVSAEYAVPFSPEPGGKNRYLCQISNGTNAIRIALVGMLASTATASVIFNPGANFNAPGIVSANALSKLAASWDGTTAMMALNGAPPTSLAEATPTGMTTMVLGNNIITGANTFHGYLQRLAYWPRALSAAELQAVTT